MHQRSVVTRPARSSITLYRLGVGGAALLLLGLSLIAPPLRFMVCALIFLFGPGLLIEPWLQIELPLLARPALWLGLSLALIPLAYLWLPALGLALTTSWTAIAVALGGGIAWRLGVRQPNLLPKGQGLSPAVLLVLAAVLLITGWTRWLHIKGLALPAWVDSVHHALMIRVMTETGRPPFSLRPYLAVDQFSYHWGYHSVAAPIVIASKQALPSAMLWLGQILNTLHVIALGGCAAALWRRPVAAIGAGIVVGVLSIMPAFYVSWGRYTLLTGLLILPAALIVSWEALRQPGWRGIGGLAILLAGLCITHFVAFSFALLWCAAVWLTQPTQQRWQLLGRLILAGVIALLLTGPWIELLVRQTLQTQANGPMSVGGNESVNGLRGAWPLLWTNNNLLLVALAACSALLAIRLRWQAAAGLTVWAGLVILAANPVWFGLPYLSFLNNGIVAMALFGPVALLIGGGLAAGDDLLLSRLRTSRPAAEEQAGPPPDRGRAWRVVRNGALVSFTLWQAFQFDAVINQETIIANQDDLAAIAWVGANTPLDARFAVNTIGWNQYRIARGSDGGWWILSLTGRQVSTPPVVYFYGPAEYRNQVRATTTWLAEAKAKTPAELATWMQANGFNYVYATATGRLFKGPELAGSPYFEQLYQQGSVWILRLAPPP